MVSRHNFASSHITTTFLFQINNICFSKNNAYNKVQKVSLIKILAAVQSLLNNVGKCSGKLLCRVLKHLPKGLESTTLLRINSSIVTFPKCCVDFMETFTCSLQLAKTLEGSSE